MTIQLEYGGGVSQQESDGYQEEVMFWRKERIGRWDADFWISGFGTDLDVLLPQQWEPVTIEILERESHD